MDLVSLVYLPLSLVCSGLPKLLHVILGKNYPFELKIGMISPVLPACWNSKGLELVSQRYYFPHQNLLIIFRVHIFANSDTIYPIT